jgi:hypothetical protein
VLERFGKENANSVSTPLANHFKLLASQCPRTKGKVGDMSKVPYASAVRYLMYAVVCTRTNSAHAMSTVNKYMSNLEREHWRAMKWILRYLSGTVDHGCILARHEGCVSVGGFVNVDYTGDMDDNISTTGCISLS